MQSDREKNKNNKTKVMIIALKYFPASGGSASYAYNMAIGLHRLGYEIRMLAPEYKHRIMDDSSTPFKIKRLPFMHKRKRLEVLYRIVFLSILILIEYIRFRPDVVWSTSFAGCRTLGMLTFLKTKFVATIHGGGIHRRYPSKKRSQKIADWFGLRFLNRANSLITISEESKKIFVNKLPYDNIIKKIQIIYNSLDYNEDNFFTYRNAIKDFPSLKNKKIILTVARLVSAKGHDIVIKSLNYLKDKFPDIRYIIVGEGVESESLKELVKREKLEDFVIFAGYVSDEELEKYYAICDIFVMAGRWTPKFVEGFGLVYIEAGLRGKPVIGTNVGGIPEAIIDNKTGFIVEPENPKAIAEKIQYLLKNESKREKIGVFASKYIKSNFSNEVMAKHNSDVIIKLLE